MTAGPSFPNDCCFSREACNCKEEDQMMRGAPLQEREAAEAAQDDLEERGQSVKRSGPNERYEDHVKLRGAVIHVLGVMQILGWETAAESDDLETTRDVIAARAAQDAYYELKKAIGPVGWFAAWIFRDIIIAKMEKVEAAQARNEIVKEFNEWVPPPVLADTEERQSGEKAIHRDGTSSPVRDSQPTEGEAGPCPPKPKR